MKYFKEGKVGDEVFGLVYGKGKIANILRYHF